MSAFCCGLICVVFFAAKPFYKNNERGTSWIITCLSSFLLSVCGSMQVIKFVMGLEGFEQEVIYSDNFLDRICVTFFLWVNLMDLILGFFYYPSQLNILTSYAHHIFYILWILGLMAHRTTHGFQYCFFEEIPTFLVAIGNLSPALRSDLLFGLSFFWIRIVYHIYLCYRLMKCMWNSWAWVVSSSVTIMHFFWMYKWLGSMRRRSARKEGSDKIK